MGTPRHEMNISPTGSKPRAEVAADTARAHNRDLHDVSSIARACRAGSKNLPGDIRGARCPVACLVGATFTKSFDSLVEHGSIPELIVGVPRFRSVGRVK
jgi:hypothetical protein